MPAGGGDQPCWKPVLAIGLPGLFIPIAQTPTGLFVERLLKSPRFGGNFQRFLGNFTLTFIYATDFSLWVGQFSRSTFVLFLLC